MMPSPKRVTLHADKILTVLRSHKGRQLTRSEIAAEIGKRRLTAYDIALLGLLIEQGLIESSKRSGGSRDGYVWVYTAKEADK